MSNGTAAFSDTKTLNLPKNSSEIIFNIKSDITLEQTTNETSSLSFLSKHIDKANNMLNAGEYDAAYTELEAAANRFISYRNDIHKTFNNSISHLSTLGSRATPPHPITTPLIKLRRKLKY